MIPRQYRDPRWLLLREYIIKRDFFTCQSCQTVLPDNKLQAHHLRYNGDFYRPWETDPEDLMALCKECHEAVEVAIKIVRENPQIRALPHIVNRTMMLDSDSGQEWCKKLLLQAISLCKERDEKEPQQDAQESIIPEP